MKERPVLFSAPMVRALLAGTKTQTRRVLKPAPLPPVARWVMSDHWWIPEAFSERVKQQFITTWPDALRCPYGQPGDRLWVREAFDPIYGQSPPDRIIEVDYRADWEPNGKHWRMKDEMGLRRWKPSIHMPRDLSRIMLEIVSVRVERLHEISEADAAAEGLETVRVSESDFRYLDYLRAGKIDVGEKEATCGSAIKSYATLWESINGPGSWDANPWLWVVEFRRVQP